MGGCQRGSECVSSGNSDHCSDGKGAASSCSSVCSAQLTMDHPAVASILAKLPAEQTQSPAQLHLVACLQAFVAPELLQGEDAYECQGCAVQRAHEYAAEASAAASRPLPALKWLQVVHPPPPVLT